MIEIKKVVNDEMANECDEMLTMLLQSERKYDENIRADYKVNGFYKNKYPEETSVLYMAYDSTKPVGYVYGYIKTEKGSFAYYSTAYVDALYVKEKFRNCGVASSLLDEFYKWCKDREVKSIEIAVFKDNIDAVKLYEREDFRKNVYILIKEL